MNHPLPQEKTVVIRICHDVMEANLVKSVLQSNGIECFITNENFATLMPVYNSMMGGMIKILVMEHDAEQARSILAETHPQESRIVCPECNSMNVKYGFGKKKVLKILSMILSFLIILPLMPNLLTYHCRDCGCEFTR